MIDEVGAITGEHDYRDSSGLECDTGGRVSPGHTLPAFSLFSFSISSFNSSARKQ